LLSLIIFSLAVAHQLEQLIEVVLDFHRITKYLQFIRYYSICLHYNYKWARIQ